jgi:hypothetical protein
MKNTYIDKYITCPFYSREESSVTRKIHCEGYMEGTHFHICFDSKDLKKLHKKKFCKNDKDYLKCPLYLVIAKRYKEDGSK